MTVPACKAVKLGDNMYSVTTLDNSKVLFAHKASRKYFTSEGKLIKLDSNGIAVLPKDAKIAACKLSHFVYQQVLLARSPLKSIL